MRKDAACGPSLRRDPQSCEPPGACVLRERSRGAESFFIGLGQALVDLRELVLREGVPSVLARSIRVYTCGCQQFSGGWSPQSMCTASELLGLCA